MAKRKVTTASKAKPVNPAPAPDPPVAVPAGPPVEEAPPPFELPEVPKPESPGLVKQAARDEAQAEILRLARLLAYCDNRMARLAYVQKIRVAITAYDAQGE